MVASRALLGVAIPITSARVRAPEVWLGAMIVAGFLSDIYDGVLARRWRTATAALRVADSAADTVFYIGVLVVVVERHWPVIHARWWLLAALLGLEAARIIFDWLKFGRMASYHSYASKAWSALLVLATIALLCFNRGFWLTTVALAWGILCDLEGLAMSAVLPRWTHDVKNLRRALRIRQKMLAQPVQANEYEVHS
jgi:CDP-diacylglycerol--glycerol-3-phosphate 3-phosphatidyltransferase